MKLYILALHIYLFIILLEDTVIYYYKDQIWIPSLLREWTKAQKTQNNEFVENKLENWALVNQTNIRRDSND